MKAYTIADDPSLVWTDPEAFKRFAIAPLIYGSDNRKADFDKWMKMSADDIANHRDTAGTYSILDNYEQKEGDYVNPSLRDLYNSKDDTDPFDEEVYRLTDRPEEKMNIEDLIKNAPEEFLDEDELIDYITSNYDGQFPEDNDSDEIWAEFYADGSPFRSYEDALRKGLKGRIKLSEEPSEDESDEPHDEKTVKEAVKSKEPSDKKVEKILDKIGTQVMDNVIDEHINKTRKAGASFKPHSEEAVQAMLEANKKGTVLSDATVKNIVGTLSQYRW